MSTHGTGSGLVRTSPPSRYRSDCMNTRFQISTQLSPSSTGQAAAGAAPGAAPGAGPWRRKISEQGPQGPVSAISQKLSASPLANSRSRGTPTFRRHRSADSPSFSWTVT